MKLHRIGVTNLNSLYGTHGVDLDRDLEGASLFLIEGPTGSGKSTLMDAVSLALFGTTPRMEAQRSDRSVAEQVMSRDTGVCQAELVFSKWSHGEGRRVHFRARWIARRAREKPDGQIQATERSLERRTGEGGWEILVSDKRQKVCQPHFDAVLEGFNPEDFRRSMLLAQGQFDAMLHARPEERARILERLTDTSEYKRIGEGAARIHRAWRDRTRDLDRELQGREPVPPETVAEAEKTRTDGEAALARVEERSEAVRVRRDWLKAEGEWARKVEAARDERDAAGTALESRAGLAARIREHDRCVAGFEALDAVEGQRRRVEEAGERIRALETQLPGLRESLREATAERDARADRHAAAEAALRRLEPAVDRAETARIRHQATAREEATARGALEKAGGDLESRQTRLSEARRTLAEALNELWGEVAPEAVPPGASPWRAEAEAALAFHGIPQAGAIPDATPQGEAAPGAAAEGLGDVPEAPGFAGAQQAIRALRVRAESQADSVRRALESRVALAAAEGELQSRERALAAARQAAAEAVEAVARADGERSAARQLRDRAREVMAPLERLRVHQEERRKLVRGEPCPLCGSTDHPLADDEADTALQREITAAQEALGAAEAGLAAAEAAFHTARGNREAARARSEEQEAELAAAASSVEAASAAWLALAVALELDPGTGPEALRGREGELGGIRSWLQEILEGVSVAGTRFTEWSGALGELRTAETRLVETREVQQATAASAEEAREAFEEAMEALRGAWGAALELDDEDPRDRPGTADDPRALKESQQRVLRALAGALDAARDAWTTAEQSVIRAESELETRIATRTADVEQLGTLEQRLAAELERLDVDSEGALAARRLDPDVLGGGRSEVEGLRKALEEAQTRLAILRGEQAAHAEARPDPFALEWMDGEPTPERCAAVLEGLARDRGALNEQISEARSVLLEAERVAEEIQALESAREATRTRGEVWHRLHDLIGVNDGDRFREFAQAMNLDQLLDRANRHLATLKDRYRLVTVRDPQTGVPTLEFEVEDRWRPGTTRSLRTLSGGESFLVSLALALGLSDLRTSSMPVETLLLDEGFGTLDPETLDEALAALQQLQASGRQIGIISHVAGLKERIDARIQVEPLGNGRSRVRAVVAGLS